MQQICFNGTFLSAEEPVLLAGNRAFKFGDGVFETMRFRNGSLLLSHFHFDRLFSSLKVLHIPANDLKEGQLLNAIEELCSRNGCASSARVRLQVYREGRGCAYVIEAFPLPLEGEQWPRKGYVVDVFPFARKACDAYANLKSANYLPYVLADIHATEQGLDECLVLNAFNQICDGSKTNVFALLGNEVITPGLDQGCVNGVMRRQVMEQLKGLGRAVKQQPVSLDDLLQADAVFLTNAVRGIRWVHQLKQRRYEEAAARALCEPIQLY